MGDRNSVFEGKLDRFIVGPQGLGKINQSVQMLTDFCERNATGLKSQEKTVPWKAEKINIEVTWTIVYIFVKQRIRNSEKAEQVSDMACSECCLLRQFNDCKCQH
jgi:hypothetical protein